VMKSDTLAKTFTDESSTATESQIRAISFLFKGVDVAGPARCDAVNQIVGRRINSLDDLAKRDAEIVIRQLESDRRSAKGRA
jgi:hypothetical protein